MKQLSKKDILFLLYVAMLFVFSFIYSGAIENHRQEHPSLMAYQISAYFTSLKLLLTQPIMILFVIKLFESAYHKTKLGVYDIVVFVKNKYSNCLLYVLSIFMMEMILFMATKCCFIHSFAGNISAIMAILHKALSLCIIALLINTAFIIAQNNCPFRQAIKMNIKHIYSNPSSMVIYLLCGMANMFFNYIALIITTYVHNAFNLYLGYAIYYLIKTTVQLFLCSVIFCNYYTRKSNME